jgi:transcriptional regulator with XRE-family HTH domain
MRTSSIWAVAGSSAARSTAALIATPPSWVAGTPASAPPNLPMGVRAALTMKVWPLGSCTSRVYARARDKRAVSAWRQARRMDDQRIGAALRAIRVRKGWRQVDLARRAGVSRWVVLRIERGRIASIPVGKLREVALALDARIDSVVRWQGGDLPRLLNARHARMHEVMARFFGDLSDWIAEPEVSFSIYGERGIIDVLAWHTTRRVLLVIELKTEIVDVNELLGTLDRKRRLAVDVARSRGWDPSAVATWVVLASSRSNRRTIDEHATVLGAKLPADGRAIRRWLLDPHGAIDAPSFVPSVQGVHLGSSLAPVRRVNRRRTA